MVHTVKNVNNRYKPTTFTPLKDFNKNVKIVMLVIVVMLMVSHFIKTLKDYSTKLWKKNIVRLYVINWPSRHLQTTAMPMLVYSSEPYRKK